MALAAPLDTLIDGLTVVCAADVPPIILEQIGGANTQQVLCQIRDIAARARGLVDAAEQGGAAFLNRALDEGFRVLRETSVLGTDLDALEALVRDARRVIADGVSYESAMAFLARHTASQRVAELAAPSEAEEGSVRWFVEENRRLNPDVTATALDAIETTAELMEKTAESVGLAQKAHELASAAVLRGDEATITLNVTNPDPTGLSGEGIADRAAERAKNATSTRAAVQVLLDFQADALRQRALETTSLLTAIKEQNLQQGYTVKQLSLIAQQLYSAQIEEENRWRAAQRTKIEGELLDVEEVGESFMSVASALRSISSNLSGDD